MRRMQNNVQLTGRLLNTPELKRMSDGALLINLRLATPRQTSRVGRDSDQNVFHLVVWEGLALSMVEKFEKGSRLSVSGELRNRSMAKNGIHYYRTEILVLEYQALERNDLESRAQFMN